MTDCTYSKTFRKLIAWQEAHKLTILVYQITKSFPSDERFAMTQQLRRAAYSIESQLSEGSMMRTAKHRYSFYERSLASAVEVDNFIQLAFDLKYIIETDRKRIVEQINRTCALINRLIKALNNHKISAYT